MIEVKGIKLDPKWKWLAKDADGKVYVFSVIPTTLVTTWAVEGSGLSIFAPLQLNESLCWEDSLYEIIHTEDGFKLIKPRPDLKIDDPVMVRVGDNKGWHRRHFAGWSESGTILVWVHGYTSFTTDISTTFNQYRLPTPEELNRNK